MSKEAQNRSTKALMEGRKAKKGDPCPYSAKAQRVEHHSWRASYYDKYGADEQYKKDEERPKNA